MFFENETNLYQSSKHNTGEQNVSFGIQVTKTVDEAYIIDQQMGTTFWKK